MVTMEFEEMFEEYEEEVRLSRESGNVLDKHHHLFNARAKAEALKASYPVQANQYFNRIGKRGN